MSLGDITPLNDASFGIIGSRTHQVASGGTPPAILAGEPVGKTLGTNTQYVITLATNTPTTSATVLGIAATSSTETSTAAGTVDVLPWVPGQIWLVAPKVAATWNTQALYNALVGSRVLLDKTSGVYTILAADSSANGCIVENLDINKYPNKVAFSFRAAASFYGV